MHLFHAAGSVCRFATRLRHDNRGSGSHSQGHGPPAHGRGRNSHHVASLLAAAAAHNERVAGVTP